MDREAEGRAGEVSVTKRSTSAVDSLTDRQRSELMSRIRGKDTKPEMRVRRIVHGMGYRYRLHAKELAGCPDIVFRLRRKAIFVHGCFWHRHSGCSANRIPKTRAYYWRAKLNRNVERDQSNEAALRADGWSVLVIWECETKGDSEQLMRRLRAFLA